MKKKKYVVAYGEVTGHKHVLESQGYMNVIKQAEQAIFDFISGNSELSHEEHDRVLFLEGSEYTQLQMREVEPLTGLIRSVMD